MTNREKLNTLTDHQLAAFICRTSDTIARMCTDSVGGMEDFLVDDVVNYKWIWEQFHAIYGK